MTKNNDKQWSGCPIRYAVGIFGDRWSLLIIRDRMFKERRYYSDFLSAGEGISTNILADRLANLVKTGIINKKKDSKNGAKVIYFLTEKGRALMPVMLAMIDWSETYDYDTEVPEEFINTLRYDKESLEKALTECLDKIIS